MTDDTARFNGEREQSRHTPYLTVIYPDGVKQTEHCWCNAMRCTDEQGKLEWLDSPYTDAAGWYLEPRARSPYRKCGQGALGDRSTKSSALEREEGKHDNDADNRLENVELGASQAACSALPHMREAARAGYL